MSETATVTATVTYKADVVSVNAMKYETRCPYPRCNRILFKGILAEGSRIEIQCPKCKNMSILQVVAPQ